jgi:hypothetical protein
MIRYDLPSLSAVLLTVARNAARHPPLREFFGQHRYRDVRWVFGRPTSNHHAGAREMAIQTLRSIRCPVLWLEDDARALPAYQDQIEAPDDAQVAYLGGMPHGPSGVLRRHLREIGRSAALRGAEQCLGGTRGPRHRAIYRDTPDRRWVRILTMAGSHAILWLDDAVRLAMAESIEESARMYDVAMALQQWRFLIYGLRAPWFYQDDGHHEGTKCYCPE